MIKALLTVMDDCEASTPFLTRAVQLAEAHDADLDIDVLTATPMLAPALSPFTGIYVPDAQTLSVEAANLARLEKQLATAKCRHRISGFHGDVAWLAGDLRQSRQIADLIMVGTRQTWEVEWLRRHVIETLIRASGSPILLLPAEPRFERFHHIVLGWKSSPEAVRAVHALTAIAEPGARIELVTICEDLAAPRPATEGHDHARLHLERHGFTVDSHWLERGGQTEARALEQFAVDQGADALAIGGFAHSRVRDIILGSVTEALVERCTFPVLMVG